jgi:IS30 family transposase
LGGRPRIGAAHKLAIVTLVERKSGYALIAIVSNKTSDLVSLSIITKINAVTLLVKTLTFNSSTQFAQHSSLGFKTTNKVFMHSLKRFALRV